MLGRETSALVGIDPATLLVDGGRAAARPTRYEALIVRGAVDEDYNEYRIALPDGRVRHFAVSSTRTDWNGRPAMLGVLPRHLAPARRDGRAARQRGALSHDDRVAQRGRDDLRRRRRGSRASTRPRERLLGATFEQMRHNSVGRLAADRRRRRRRCRPSRSRSPSCWPPASRCATQLLGMRTRRAGVRWLDVNCEPLRDAAPGAVTGGAAVDDRRHRGAPRRGGAARQREHQPHADGRAGRRRLRGAGLPLRLRQPAAAGAPGLRARGVHRPAVRARRRARAAAGVERALPRPRRRGRGAGAHVRGAVPAQGRQRSPSSSWWPTAPRSRTGPRCWACCATSPSARRAAAELERHRDRLEELVHERTRELEAAVAARIAERELRADDDRPPAHAAGLRRPRAQAAVRQPRVAQLVRQDARGGARPRRPRRRWAT